MQKIKLNFLITLFITLLLLFNTFCFAVESDEIMLISDPTQKSATVDSNILYSDLYISQDGEYTINNIIDGNAFINADTVNIDPINDGGIVKGNLSVIANSVNIKSDFKYSETIKDELGNFKLESVNNFSTIYGNVFVFANTFVLDPKCEINGDLYICAKEINLSQDAIIRGNVFVFGDTLNLNSQINDGDLYANVNNFNMDYYGFINRDLHLTAENVNLEGYIYRNSFIDAKNITTTSSFINTKDFNIENALNVTFSGRVAGNANINSKNINLKSKDDNSNSISCTISGNLDYSSYNEINFEDNVVLGKINYTKYNSSNNLLSNIGIYFIELLTSLTYVIIIYLALNKFAPKFIENLSNISSSNILKFLGIGILLFVGVPALSILLLLTQIGSLLGILLAIIYALLLIIAKPMLAITISKIINKKITSINKYVILVITTLALSLLTLIPYFGFIISILVLVMGLGLIAKTLLPNKK